MNSENILRNKTYTYICPILVPYINMIKDNLLNTYIGDVDHPELDNNIFLLYNFENTERHIAYEAYLQTLSIFVNMYEPTENTTMFVFKVPKAYQKIYNLYKKGKYSKYTHIRWIENNLSLFTYSDLGDNPPRK